VKLTTVGKHFNPAILIRLMRLAGCSLILLLGTAAPSLSQDISSIKSMLAAKQCPPSEYSRISYDDRGCGFSGQKACDQRYRAPSDAWQDCYHQLKLCHDQIDADNQVIYEANRVFHACQQHKADADQSLTGSQPKAGYSSSGPSSPGNSGSSDLASRLAAQQAKNATANDVRQQQDQQFSDSVQSAKQEYQQYKAQEQAEQEAREQEQRRNQQRLRTRDQAQSRQSNAAGWQCFPSYDQCMSSCRATIGWDDNGLCGGRCSDGGIGNDPTPPELGKNCWRTR